MTSKSTSSFYDNYYRLNNRWLLLVGLCPYQSYSDRVVRSLIVNVTLVIAFLFQIYQFYACSFEIESIIKELQLFVVFLCCSMSYYNTILHFVTWKKICDRIVRDWKQLLNEEEIIIMRRYAKKSEQYTMALTLICYLFGSFLTLPSIFHVLLYAVRITNDTQLMLPFPMISFSHSKQHFYYMLLLQIWGIWILCVLGIVIYSSFILSITHACGLLSLVMFTIGRPYKKDSRDVFTSGVIHDSYEWVKEIVRRYGNTIEFVNMINSATERVFMIEIFFAMLLIIVNFLYLFHSLEMFKTYVLLQYFYEVFACSIYIVGSVSTLYITFYLGQKLMDHGTRVHESFYQVSWYELPPRCQKALPLLIMRSTKPCVISIGGIFVASHEFFARFVNTSLSYAMVCSKMR